MSLELVDFGVHVADNKTVYKKIVVKNTGSTPAPYRIDYRGANPIGFSPHSALIQPNSSITVDVRFIKITIIFHDKIFLVFFRSLC